jgi:hypothetical protein
MHWILSDFSNSSVCFLREYVCVFFTFSWHIPNIYNSPWDILGIWYSLTGWITSKCLEESHTKISTEDINLQRYQSHSSTGVILTLQESKYSVVLQALAQHPRKGCEHCEHYIEFSSDLHFWPFSSQIFQELSKGQSLIR